MRRWGVRLLIALFVALALAEVCALFLPRYESVLEPGAPYDEARIAEKMDPWLLAEGLTSRLVVEVDWVEGCKPGPLALDGLKVILEKYGPPGRTVEILRSDEIPRAEWDGLKGSERVAGNRMIPEAGPLVDRYASMISGGGTEHRYVLFAPSAATLFGVSTRWPVTRDGRTAVVRGVIIFHERHARFARLWISVDKFERQTLIHEFGHQFGLVSDPRHERRDVFHRRHCNRLDCLMAHPTPRVIARNFLRGTIGYFYSDYCDECQSEIRTAQAVWRHQRAEDPQWEAKLRSRRAVEERSVPIWELLGQERYQEALTEIENAIREFPESASLRAAHIRALTGLDRLDEALAEWQPPAGDQYRDIDSASAAWSFAWALLARGRHAEAYSVLEPFLREDQDGILYEQTLHPAIWALEGCGRFGDAADRILVLLPRRHFVSTDRLSMQRWAASLLRRAGRLGEADALLEPLLRGKRRGESLAEAARLRRAQGRDSDARDLLEELLEIQRKKIRSGEEPSAGARYESAEVLALLGRDRQARELIAEADAPLSDDETDERTRTRRGLLRSRALMALGDYETAVEFWRQFDDHVTGGADPCTEESLDLIRHDPGYADLFHCCPGAMATPDRAPQSWGPVPRREGALPTGSIERNGRASVRSRCGRPCRSACRRPI